MDPSSNFYSALTSASFTLLGIWFAVMQLGHGQWRENRHRSTLHIALHFFLPGLGGLVALLSGSVGGGVVWRATFLVVAVVGLVEAATFLRAPDAPRATAGRVLALLDLPVYVLIGVGTFIQPGQLPLTPLQVEGLANAALFAIGLCVVWLAFAEREVPLPAGEG